MLSRFITSQNVYPDETDDKCYILPKYLCYACYIDKVYTGHALDIEGFFYHRGYTHRFGMVGAIYGSETTMIFKKTLVFVQRINTCLIS